MKTTAKPKRELTGEEIERIMERASPVDRLAYELWIAGARISAISNQLHHFLKREDLKDARTHYRSLAKRALIWPDEPTCIKCGCTEFNACAGGCSWAFVGGVTENYGLCSVCLVTIAKKAGLF